MCTDHGVDWYAAANAAEDILRFIRTPLTKALDPLDDADFVKMTAKMARDLESKRRAIVEDDVRAAIDSLDVAWTELTPAAQAAVVEAANTAVRMAEVRTLPAIRETIEVTFEDTSFASARSMTTKFDLAIDLSTDLVDPKVVEAASRQEIYFTDEFANRSQSFSAKGRDIIQSGLDQGLRSADITADLRAAARQVHFKRSEHYMRVVASQAMNSSRVYGALRGLEEADIDTYVFEAVLDERTTEVCRMMHGTVFRVGDALKRYSDIAASSDPEIVKDLKPWVRERVNRQTGKREMFVRDRNGIETLVGVVDEPGFGEADRIGEYSSKLSIPTMDQLGLSYPPLHGLCRSTIIPAD